MKNKILIGSTVLMLASMPILGANTMEMGRHNHYDTGEFYHANEFSMDLFGTASVGKFTIDNPSTDRIRNNSELGVGVGLTYFMTRNFGIGAEAYAEDTDGVFVDSASVNLTLRFPLGESGGAPYVFGGGGNQFDLNDVWFGQAGVGYEHRFTHGVGVFADARMVWPEETQYYGVVRLGLRFTF